MPRAKLTTKKLAQRIDLNYFKRPHPFRRWRFQLSVGLPILALIWLAWYGLSRNNRVYSSGQLSVAHAVLTERCGACHVSQAGSFRAQANDEACLTCHDGPIHHAEQLYTPSCASCHVEHRGHVRLAATPDASCTQCHRNLRTVGSAPRFARDITGFNTNHPEFASVRPGYLDPGTIKLNHAVHLKRDLKGPDGPVQLDCADCHRTLAASQVWRFGLAQPGGVPVSIASPPSQVAARAYMAPISYAKHCGACHPLQFDNRFRESVPHDIPEVVHAFVIKKFQDYIAAHPAELHVIASGKNLPGKPLSAAMRALTPQGWVNERVDESEQLLWGKTCKECHSLSFAEGALLPTVAKSNIAARWFQHAVFDHEQHRMLTCTSCHSQALTSQETKDVLLPGIATCQQCHHPGAEGAESRCFECHVYHDWRREKDVRGKFSLSDLRPGSQATSSERESTPMKAK